MTILSGNQDRATGKRKFINKKNCKEFDVSKQLNHRMMYNTKTTVHTIRGLRLRGVQSRAKQTFREGSMFASCQTLQPPEVVVSEKSEGIY